MDEGARGTRCAVSLRHGHPRRSLYADSGGDAPSPRLHSLDRNRLLPNPTLVRAGWRTIRLLAARRWAGVITATTAPPPFFMAASPIMTTRPRPWPHGWDGSRRKRSNKGAPGIDGQDFADIEAYGVERWLAELALALSYC